VEAAKTLGGSFKLVTLAPKTVREMTSGLISMSLCGIWTAVNLPQSIIYLYY